MESAPSKAAKGKAPKASKEPKAPKEPKETKAKRGGANSSGGGGKKSKKGDGDGGGRVTPVEDDLDEVDLAARPDPSEGAAIVVIHPGSTNLRIGLSNQATPRIIPHCIAYRRTPPSDDAAPREAGAPGTAGEVAAKSIEPALTPLARQLRVGVRLVGKEYPPAAPSAVPVSAAEVATAAAEGGILGPSDMPGAADGGLVSFDSARMLVGDAAIRACAAAPDEWHLVHPLKWGALNLRDGLSERGLLSALEQIWRCTICGGGGEPGLGLRQSELGSACVVLALPDLFDRRFGSEVLSLLLSPAGLGFKAALVHEEAACAAFGVGTGSACVVDIGAERTSVCCIDEGMPMPGCRQLLAYGCTDMDVLTHTLLHRHRLAPSVPHLAVPPSYTPTLPAALSLRAIRHRCGSLHLVDDPATITGVDVPPPPLSPTDGFARVQLGSLSPLPPLLLFAPSVAAAMQKALGFTRPANTVSTAAPTVGAEGADGGKGGGGAGGGGKGSEDSGRIGAPEAKSAHAVADHTDVLDDDFITETALERALPSGVTPAGPKDVFVGAANFSPQLTEVGTRLTTGLTPDAQIGFTPLDEAIVRAVERGKSTEVKRRLYGTIVLLGGGARTPGLAEFLEWRVHCCWRIAMDSTEGIDKVEVVRLPVGTEPDCVVWFGAAVLPALETGRAMWILQKDWEKSGALAAREVCAFSW